MVSQCKICGARTSGHRQYCPNCRPWKGRNKPLVNKTISGMIVNAIPFIHIIYGIYLIKTKKILDGIILIILGIFFVYVMLSTKERRDKFMERQMR